MKQAMKSRLACIYAKNPDAPVYQLEELNILLALQAFCWISGGWHACTETRKTSKKLREGKECWHGTPCRAGFLDAAAMLTANPGQIYDFGGQLYEFYRIIV
jgi:hypothetical protein